MPAGDSLWRYLLILAVLGNCLPCFAPEDANRDRRVDLSDAVAQVRSLVEAAENQGAERIDIQKAIVAVSAIAGLGPRIEPQDPVSQQATTPFLDHFYCISEFSVVQDPSWGIPFLFENTAFSSSTIAPDVPPPRFAVV
jgi:hypothetical protein